MYRCQVCGVCSAPRATRLLHVVYRTKFEMRTVDGVLQRVPRKEIAREVPVCRECKGTLDSGVTLEALAAYYAPEPPPRRDPAPRTPPAATPSTLEAGPLDLGKPMEMM